MELSPRFLDFYVGGQREVRARTPNLDSTSGSYSTMISPGSGSGINVFNGQAGNPATYMKISSTAATVPVAFSNTTLLQ